MIRLREHIPTYCDGIAPRTVEADTQDALLATPWIARRAEGEIVVRNGEVRRRPFHRFSRSDSHLMAEYDEGRHWWVVGTIIDGLESLSLPTWTTHPDGERGVREWNRGNTSYDDGRFTHWPLVTP